MASGGIERNGLWGPQMWAREGGRLQLVFYYNAKNEIEGLGLGIRNSREGLPNSHFNSGKIHQENP